MKATAIAPANIAFIKYWGKDDSVLRLPLNSSISMNLSGCRTTTTVEFFDSYDKDVVKSVDEAFSDKEITRVSTHLDRLRAKAGNSKRAHVVTKNSFPKSAGVASSASGFAALTVAGAGALGLKLSEKELSILARLGSGSACRSIPDGFVEWVKGNSSQTSYARSFYPHDYWDVRDVVVVESSQKEVGSTEGMDKIRTSPFWGRRLRDIPDRIKRVKKSLERRDLKMLGEVIEEDCVSMHAVAMTQKPPLFYWSGITAEIILAVREWREEGLSVYFTIDAGPNVHLICEARHEEVVVKKARTLSGVEQVIINKPARGARLVDTHLF